MTTALRLALLLTVAARVPAAELVWPDPPEQPRIRFLRSITPSVVEGKPSFFAKLWHVLTGEKKQPFMTQPYGVCVGPRGRLYVADTFGRALHSYDLQKNEYTELHVDGDSLIGVAAIGDRLFVTDSVRAKLTCIDAKGKRIWSVGAEAGFQRPTGIAAVGEKLYVVDTLANRVVTVASTGKLLGGFGARGRGPAEFNFPTNIASGRDGRLYVCDSMNFRIQVFDSEGKFLSQFGRLGDGSGDFNKPKGVAVDSDGNIYVVEGLNDVVQIFDEAGRLLLFFGGSGGGDGEFWLPTGIAIHDDKIYVSDSSNRRIQMFEYLKE